MAQAAIPTWIVSTIGESFLSFFFLFSQMLKVIEEQQFQLLLAQGVPAFKYMCGFISVVKPTRCTNVTNLFYFGMTFYMFRTVFPSIIKSSRLYIQQPNRYCCLLASG